MAYIQEFTVTGLAGSTETLTRKLDRHVNVFWGMNGTGKTSLLKILSSAMANDAEKLNRVPFESAEVIIRSDKYETVFVRSISKNSTTTGELLFDEVEYVEVDDWDNPDELPFSWLTKMTSELDTNPQLRPGVYCQHSYLPISRLTATQKQQRLHRGPRAAAIDEDFLDEEFANHVRMRWTTYNSDALARIRVIQQQGLASILDILFGSAQGTLVGPDEVSPDAAYHTVRQFLKDQGISPRFTKAEFQGIYEDRAKSGVVARIEAVKREVDQALRPQVEFQDVIESLYSGGKEIIMRAGHSGHVLSVVQNGNRIPLESLSSGEKQLLRLMLETLAAEENTIMIDEPELSMHVDWQQTLVNAMRRVNPECQIILATHSPEIMAEISDDVVFQL